MNIKKFEEIEYNIDLSEDKVLTLSEFDPIKYKSTPVKYNSNKILNILMEYLRAKVLEKLDTVKISKNDLLTQIKPITIQQLQTFIDEFKIIKQSKDINFNIIDNGDFVIFNNLN